MKMGMTTIQESRILEALQQAQSVGIVEESVTVCGCTITMRNLRPEEYENIVQESSDKQDATFLYTFQMGHICRAVCEINGIDLRGLDYVETELPDPKNPGQVKKVKLERHEWLRQRVLVTWSRESLSVLYRKFVDVLAKAEAKSVEGVMFTVPDETDDDKFRRLMTEVKALEDELPDELVDHVLEEHGYRRKASDQKAGAEKLDAMAKEAAPKPYEAQGEAPDYRTPASVEEAARPAKTLVMATNPVLRTMAVPDEPAPVPVAVTPPGVDPMELIRRKPGPRTRADQIAELEAATANLAAIATPELPSKPVDSDQVVLEKPQARLDPNGAASILDKPPIVGINPRFRPHGQ